MLRSSSFAFFDILRVCWGLHPSTCCRILLLRHDVHWGTSAETRIDAIGVVQRGVMTRKKLCVAVEADVEMLATAEGGIRCRPCACLWLGILCGRLPHLANAKCLPP